MKPSIPPSQTERVSSRSALVIAPHFDDEVLGCGGLIAQLAASRTAIAVLFLSNSCGFPGEPGGGPEYGHRRRLESEKACALLGVSEFFNLYLPDSELDRAEHVAAASRGIEERLRAAMPDLLLLPSPLEISTDHRAALAALHEAIQRLRPSHEDGIRSLRVLLYEVNHASFPDVLVDVSKESATIEQAMACYASQQERHDYLGAALGLRRFRTLTLSPAISLAEGYRRLSGWDIATRSLGQLVAHVGGTDHAAPIPTGPLVSVIVRTRDRPQLLAEALDSLAAGPYRQVEVVLVNDGGAPPQVRGDYPFPVVPVEHAQSRGRAAAAQAGVDAARGDYVMFLDDDDVVAPEHLATLVGAVQTTRARVAYTLAAVTDYAGDPASGWTCVGREMPYGRAFDLDRLLVDNYIPINTLLIERSLFAAAGPFDPSFEVFEDWDMVIRLALLAPFHHEAQVTCEYRHFPDLVGQALGKEAAHAPGVHEAKARVLAKHASRLDPERLARVVVGMRAETVAAQQQRRHTAQSLDRVNTELHRVYGEEGRLHTAVHALQSGPASWANTSSKVGAFMSAGHGAKAERKASVLLVSWNGRSHLETSLEALARQDAPGLRWDIWVLDNGSEDGTVEWLRTRHPAVQIIASPANVGFCAGNNRLVSATDADFVVFLNNDTLPGPNWLGELVEAIEMAPRDVAAVAGLIVDWEGERLDFGKGVMTFDGHAFQLDTRRPLTSATLPRPGEEQLFACGANMIVRRSSFVAAGGFDEQFFAYFDDVDLGWRLWSRGERVISAPRARVRHRLAGTSGRLGVYNRSFLVERNAFLTAYKNYEGGLWEQLMPATMLTLISRATAQLTADNPGGASLATDPFATAPANGRPVRRWLPRRFERGHPIISDEATIARCRALAWMTRYMDQTAERRALVQAQRKRSDQEIFERFPLHVVPTYAGDEALFQSAGFRTWLPEKPRLVFRTLKEIMGTPS